MAHPRLPLVLSATGPATRQAAALLPGAVLENVVHAAIADGALRDDPGVGERTSILLDGGVVVVLRRELSPVSRRKAWRAVAVHPPRGRAA